MMTDPRELHIPIVVKNGLLVLRNGEPLPGFCDDAKGELRIAANDLSDPARAREFLAETTKPFLPAHTHLAAEVKRDGVPSALQKELVNFNGGGRYLTCVPFTVTQNLSIVLTVGKKGRLEDCICYIPSLKLEADSINEAYTRISEAFEPGRRSHAGNVFSKVFCTQPALRSLGAIRAEIEKGAVTPGELL